MDGKGFGFHRYSRTSGQRLYTLSGEDVSSLNREHDGAALHICYIVKKHYEYSRHSGCAVDVTLELNMLRADQSGHLNSIRH